MGVLPLWKEAVVTDLSKLSEDGLYRCLVSREWSPYMVWEEIMRRFAALTARISELEQQLRVSEAKREELDRLAVCRLADREAAEKERDEALDYIVRLWAAIATVVGEEYDSFRDRVREALGVRAKETSE